jgi:hypothetical protein
LKNKSGRNDTCQCGSGKKFKNCHGRTIGRSSQTWVIVAVISLFLLWFLFFQTSPPAETTSYSPAPLIPQKLNLTSTAPGPAPPGKVWSVEHGHWHDAPLGTTTLPDQPETSAPRSQPPGDPPPGKVWSPEHGHWHDQN